MPAVIVAARDELIVGLEADQKVVDDEARVWHGQTRLRLSRSIQLRGGTRGGALATRSRLSLAVLVAAASLPAIPTTASAVKVRDGSARITLAPAFQQSLANKDVTVSPTGAASRTGNRLTLKIRRGVNPKRGRARLRLGGGLRWSLGDFTGDERVAHAAQAEETILGSMAAIVGSRRGRITGRVRAENADRERLFKLSRVRFSARQGRATATVSLARAGARELNQALQLGGTLSFRPGELVGPLKLCLGLDPAEPQC